MGPSVRLSADPSARWLRPVPFVPVRWRRKGDGSPLHERCFR